MNRLINGILTQVHLMKITLIVINCLESVSEANLALLIMILNGIGLLVLVLINEALREGTDILILGQAVQVPKSILAAYTVHLLAYV